MVFCQVALRGASSRRRGTLVQALVVLAVVAGSAALGSEMTPEQVEGQQSVQLAANPRRLLLPEWVQNTRAVSLWATATDRIEMGPTVAPLTVLRVFDAHDGRLLVGTDQAQPEGWVDVASVQPADPPAPWLQNHLPIRGYVGAYGDIPSGGAIRQFTYLRQVGPQEGSRVPVQVDPREGNNPIVWVEESALGPVGTPPRVVFTGVAPGWAAVENRAVARPVFIDVVGEAARASQAKSGVPASVTVAQAILESDWGQSSLSRIANNYFGIKATGRIGDAGVVWMRTWEVIGGQDVFLREPFRAYTSLGESIDDHARLFTGLRLYSGAMAVAKDPLSFAREIHRAGYSTDPNYVNKLIQLMDRYNLHQFNQG